MTPLRWFLAGGLTCATAATVLLLVAIARRGAPGPDEREYERGWRAAYVRAEHEATHGEAEQCGAECIALGLATFDDWASDPRTAELATGGGQEGAKK